MGDSKQLPPPLPVTAAPPHPRQQPNRLLALSVFSYLLSLPLLVAGIWLLVTRDSPCEHNLLLPSSSLSAATCGNLAACHLRAYLGIGLLTVFFISNFAVYNGSRLLLPNLFLLSIPLVFFLTLGLALAGSWPSESRVIPASPNWLRSRIASPELWANVRKCLYDSGTCSGVAYRTVGLTADQFAVVHLDHIEAGCCKPPSMCNMEYVNSTYWERPPEKAKASGGGAPPAANLTASEWFGDCHVWGNGAGALCYRCDSCKNGFFQLVHGRWKETGVFLIVVSSLLFATHMLRLIITMMSK